VSVGAPLVGWLPRVWTSADPRIKSNISKLRLLIFIVAYFAERTIDKVVRRIPVQLLDTYDVEILIIDDSSEDATFAEAVGIGRDIANIPFKVTVLYNPVNQGYGGNQKIGYHYAIENGFDFVALLHGDGQYAPEVLGDLTEPLRKGEADAVFGSRMLVHRDALNGGMPLYKFLGNRILTSAQNWLLGTKLSEFHSGYRVYAVSAIKALPFDRNSNVFHFDTEIIIQLVIACKRIKEIAIPTYYGDEICRVDGLKYAFDVIKASLQAWFQKINLFYDRRFDCAPLADGRRYPSKLAFESTHSRVIELGHEKARVLDLGSGMGAVGAALKEKKGCVVIGCDIERGALTGAFDNFFLADLNKSLPEMPGERFDYILALDVIEHLTSPEDFLDELRALAARTGARLILTTANIGFIIMRLSLLLGRFEYGKRGILDITHTRLFTFNTLRRAMRAAGFEIERSEGVVLPMPFAFGHSAVSRIALAFNHILVRLRPTLFGFQILMIGKPRPTLATLLDAARASADKKTPKVIETRAEDAEVGVNTQSIEQKVTADALFLRLARFVTRSDHFRLIRYLVAGVAVSLGYSLTIVALVDWAALLGPEAANVVSLTLWTIISYLVHREFTFRFDGAHRGPVARFILIFVLKLLASVSVIAVTTRYYKSSYLIGVFLNWVVLPLISYVAMKFWVFKRALSQTYRAANRPNYSLALRDADAKPSSTSKQSESGAGFR